MPIYEFECAGCGFRFEELTGSEDEAPACPRCAGGPVRRLMSVPSPPGRLPRGPAARDSDARRAEREAARGRQLEETRKRRARGELPGGGGG